MACHLPIRHGPNKGKPATGTPTGYQRHRTAGEPACEACKVAITEDRKRWKKANPDKVAAMGRAYREANADKERERQRRWYRENRDKVLEQSRRWAQANPDKVRARWRRWQEANPDKVREAQRRYNERNPDRQKPWREANPDKVSEYTRRWSQANRDKVAEKARRRRAQRAAALTIPFTTEQLAERMAFWGDRCWMCGGDYDTVDHVIPLAEGGPHCLSNCRPACRSCNSAKGVRHWSEFIGEAS